MNKSLLISAVILFTFTGIRASINPFKPYKPLNEIDYQLNFSLGRDTASMAYRPDRFIERTLLPLGLLSTSILYNDNYLDKRIIKLGGITQPALQSANILQYSPAGIMLLLKAAGVKGRSDWPRMITADGAAVAIQAGITNALKYTLRRERPDGRANNSYPSGHTATAFMCAHMLHKEYGETMSPWISVGGYAVATAVAIDRVCRNRHDWDDVAVGALIGIGGTELGYWIGRKLLPEKKNYAFAINGNSISMAFQF